MRWFLALALVCLGTNTLADNIIFQLTCKVIHQSVVMLNEGKTTVYSGIKDNFKTDEDLHFDVEVTRRKSLYVELADKKREDTIANFFADRTQVSYTKSENGETLAAQSEVTKKGQFVELSQDKIMLDTGFNKLVLNRYYKSDYEGLYSFFNDVGLYTQVAGMDCRTTKGGPDKVFEKYK